MKFNGSELKFEIRNACRQKRPNFFVNENLTPTRKTILWALRQMKRKRPDIVSGCNSENGKIFVWVKAGSVGNRDAKKQVNNRLQLINFCENFLKEPLSGFINEWKH